MTRPDYPLPIEDADNHPFLEAWRAGELVLQYCCECDYRVFYPRPICPRCWSDHLEWRRVIGKGEVVSYSLIYRPNHEAFNGEIPIALAEVRLLEGACLLARIIGDISELHTGANVELAVDSEGRQLPLPAFRIAPA